MGLQQPRLESEEGSTTISEGEYTQAGGKGLPSKEG
jgi:hypothetical protein